MPAEKTPDRVRQPNRFTAWRVLAFFFVSFGLLVATLFVWENRTGARALAAAKERWKAAGYPMDDPDAGLPHVPDEENFAMTPVLRDAASLKRLQAMTEPDGVGTPSLNSGEWHTYAREEPDWLAWRAFLDVPPLERKKILDREEAPPLGGLNRKLPLPAAPTVPDQVIDSAAADVLAKLNLDPALIDELARDAERPHAVFTAQHYEALIQGSEEGDIVSGLGLQGRAALRSGHTEHAAKCVAIICRLEDAFASASPSWASIYPTSRAVAFRCVAEGVRDRRWDEAALARLAPRLPSEMDGSAPRAVALRTGERARSWERKIEDGEALGYLCIHTSYYSGPFWQTRFERVVPRGWWQNNEAVTLDLAFENAFVPARDEGLMGILGHQEGYRKAQRTAETRSGRYGFARHRHSLVEHAEGRWFRCELGQWAAKRLLVQTSGRALSLAVAVERFRLAEGRLPETAAQVVPRFLPAVPQDLDGQPIRYAKKDGGFLIHSVGLDKVDDWHGRPPTPADLAEPGFRRDSPTPWLKLGPLPEGAGVKDWLFDFSPPAASPTAQ